MFTEAETKEFVILICAFAVATGLSDRQLALLFGMKHITMNRWRRLALPQPEGSKAPKVSRWMAEPIRNKIAFLNDLHTRTGLYVAINQEPPAARTAALRSELDKRAV